MTKPQSLSPFSNAKVTGHFKSLPSIWHEKQIGLEGSYKGGTLLLVVLENKVPLMVKYRFTDINIQEMQI